jgi:predicted nucleic acid-binding protein
VNRFLLDANALVKRYFPERGSALIDHLFEPANRPRLTCLMLGVVEAVAALVRKRNQGQMAAAQFTQSMTQLRVEILDDVNFEKLPTDNVLIARAISLLPVHAINSADAIVLRTALDVAASLRVSGGDLVLVTSDARLIAAAQANGLRTFDPETQTLQDLTTLL